MPLMQLSFYSLTIFSYEENSHTIFLEKEIFHPLTQRSFLHFFFFLIIIPFSSVKESFFISSLFHLLFQNKFFLLSRRFFHFFFLRSKVHGAPFRSEFNFRRDCAVSQRRIIFLQGQPGRDSNASISVSSTASSGLERIADSSDLLPAARFDVFSSTIPVWHLNIE